MGILIGYSFYGSEYFSDDLSAVRDITYAEFNDAIIDEIMVRGKTDQGTTNVRDTWNNDTYLLAKFQNSLEAGNVNNDGVKIASFEIKRKLATDLDSIHIGEVDFTTNLVEYYDFTQPNGENVYTIIPIGENGLDGTPIETNVTSSFSGVWLVNKDTNDVLVFDKTVGNNVGNVDTTMNQNRTLIETFAKYPQVFYGSELNYETFTLSTILLPDDGQQSYAKYLDVLNKFIIDHKPKIAKFDNGKVAVVDISNPKTSTPLVTWDGADYIQLSVDATEIADFIDFMKG